MNRYCGMARGLSLMLVVVAMQTSHAEAGGWLKRRTQVAAPPPAPTATAYVPTKDPDAPLGTFYPTPYVMVRGNYPVGSGYSPFDQFGDTAMGINGPYSAFRSVAAPVRLYSRGYDGRPVVTEGTSFSTPNLPAMTPVIYPTQANYFYGFPASSTPPWRKAGTGWIDQN